MAVSSEIQMLIDRMETHPEEFFNANTDPVKGEVFATVSTRWGNVVDMAMPRGEDFRLADEDRRAFAAAFEKILQQHIKNCIVKELVGGEYQQQLENRARQMELDLQAKRTANYPYGMQNQQALTRGSIEDEYIKAQVLAQQRYEMYKKQEQLTLAQRLKNAITKKPTAI